MAGSTQGLLSPSLDASTNLFASGGRNTSKCNEFLRNFGNGITSHSTFGSHCDEKLPSHDLDAAGEADDGSFFDFEPHSTAASPYTNNQFSTPNPGISSWGTDMNFHPMSPPHSASFSPKDFSYNFQHPPNIFTNLDPNNTCAQYGQVTPPDDKGNPDESFDDQLRTQLLDEPTKPAPPTVKSKKRKRPSTSTDTPTQPTKRTRKYASRNSPKNEIDTTKPEDVRRFKFLERNRVAASKCRQKKKEWTNNLETKARELQKNNSNLRIMVESLRQEMVFLKSEMLKHSSCDCPAIHEYLQSGAINNFDRSMSEEALFKREASPIEKEPGSPVGSVAVVGDVTSPAATAAASEAEDDRALEALLMSSLKHDTSEEGIASQVGG